MLKGICSLLFVLFIFNYISITMPTKKQKAIKKRVYLAILIIFIGLGIFFFLKISAYIKPLFELTFENKIELKKVEKQRINMLLLGIGGGAHDGPMLTDTIMFASIDPVKLSVTLVSIPRDLWIEDVSDKVNKIYAFSEVKERGSGLAEVKKTIGEVVGQKIDYGFRIDFSGFIKAVDLLGGIDVGIERSFDDYAYPLSGKETDTCGKIDEEIASLSAQIATGSATDFEIFPCRFEHLSFEKGKQHMDGETTLKFVRSRHALGPEGTDFARSKRQEKVIKAVKDKVFSAGTILNPVKLLGLYEIVKDSIDTDIKEEEVDDFIKLAQKMKTAEIRSVVLDVSDEVREAPSLLMNPPTSEEFAYQWVVIPKAGKNDYSEIHTYIMCVIKYNGCTSSPTSTSDNKD